MSNRTRQVDAGRSNKSRVDKSTKEFEKKNPDTKFAGWVGGFDAQYASEKDRVMRDHELKQKFISYIRSEAPDGVKPDTHINYPITEKDLKEFEDVYKAQELWRFEKYLEQMFPPDHPQSGKILKEWFPDYYERREKALDEKFNLQKRWSKLQLFGPRTADDVMLMYAVDTDRIKIPTEVPGRRTGEAKKIGIFSNLYKQQYIKPAKGYNMLSSDPTYWRIGLNNDTAVEPGDSGVPVGPFT